MSGLSEQERRVPVNGRPWGTIAWSEHVEAWQVYRRFWSSQTAERIAERGGFGIEELAEQLGHLPMTWEPDTRTRLLDGVVAGPSATARVAAAREEALTQAADDLHTLWVKEGMHFGPPGCYSSGYETWLRERAADIRKGGDESDDGLTWECGPHTNAWGGHDARCRRIRKGIDGG